MAEKPRQNRAWSRSLADLIGQAIDPVLARQGFGESDIIVHWDDIVGERLAGVCQPERLQWPPRAAKRPADALVEPATLIVRTEGAFALELQHLAPLLCERINARLGWRCVGRIALRQGPVAARPVRRKPVVTPDPTATQEAEQLAAGVEDPALRDALTRLGSRALGARAKT